MALATRHAFVPSVTSESMALAIDRHRGRFTVTSTTDGGRQGTAATEAALEQVLEMIHSGSKGND
jgi:hypothetical protein